METYEQVKPSVFVGPATWHTLKCFVANYEPTEKNKRLYKQWIELTLALFPCDICSKHAIDNYKKHDIDNYLQNKDRLYLYVSGVLQDGANEHKGIAVEDRPNYYESKRFIFESLHGHCKHCQ